MRIALFLLFLFSLGRGMAVEPNPFVLYSCPGCGTNVLIKALELLLEKDACRYLDWGLSGTARFAKYAEARGEFPVAHHWSRATLEELTEQGVLVLLNIRDPRDQLVTLFDWFSRGSYAPYEALVLEDPLERQEEMITGDRFGWSPVSKGIGCSCRVVSGLPERTWRLVRFEAFGGPDAGSDRETQVAELIDLAAFLGVEVSQERAEEVANALLGMRQCWTGRKERIGQWQEELSPSEVGLFLERHEPLLLQLGYGRKE